jgi:glycolate oxidase iron-sulfur subunit
MQHDIDAATLGPRGEAMAGAVASCVHCGFCLPTCPTYLLWGEEMDSPRGRIVLMDAALREADAVSPAMATHWDRCLGCMACVTACPSGVRYDRLIEATRPQVERNFERPAYERLLRQAAFALFTHPARLRAALPLMRVAHLAGRRLAERAPRRGWAAAMAALLRLAPDVDVRAGLRRLPERSAARGTARARVGLLQGCVQRVLFAHVNAATQRLLNAEGFEVYAPGKVRCCGALALHCGEEEQALALARRTITAFEGCDHVVVNAAGCGSAMKDYVHVLADDPAWSERAARFSAKVRDVSELLTEFEPVAPRHPLRLRVAYHDACHLAHAQQVRAQPRALLQAIPGLELVEPREWEICCGSAGLYNVLQPAAAAELGRRKAANLAATAADVIAAANPGCTLQIRAYQEGVPVPVVHPVELLAASIEAGAAP